MHPTLRARRRGVTLLEMLVTVALLLIMMLIIVAVFRNATGAVITQKAYAALDQDLRRLDQMIRQDLNGITCRMTPPMDPIEGRGYFEYAENALPDAQDEDSDDTLRFTAKAPDGQPFTGRLWVQKLVPPVDPGYAGLRSATIEPITITSQYAEIIYFLRGTKLYRRVRLIRPDLAGKLGLGNFPSDPNIAGATSRNGPSRFGFAVDLFTPAALFPAYAQVTVGGVLTPFVSWQGINDISARPSEYPANTLPANVSFFSYMPVPNGMGDLTDRQNRYASPRFADDFVSNASAPGNTVYVPDGLSDDLTVSASYPPDGVPDYWPTMYANSANAGLLNDDFVNAGATNLRPLSYDRTAFPFLFPNPYSPTDWATSTIGSVHTLDPGANPNPPNHNPLPAGTGDSLPAPSAPSTWWGFPTWRETMNPRWMDPIKRLNDPSGSLYDQAVSSSGNSAGDIFSSSDTAGTQFIGLSYRSGGPFWLPTQFPDDQPFTDGTPAAGSWFDLGGATVYEDDLIASDVRSFNIKAYDPSPVGYINGNLSALVPGYYDLGYAAVDFGTGGASLSLTSTNSEQLYSMGHEGRIPPLPNDYRYDPQYPLWSLGDNTAGVIRMRRTWDTWSTSYTNAPAIPINPTSRGPLALDANGNPQRPVVPSYPAPYPVPLRGLRIQIRLTDPKSKYVKTLTISQDFSDKL